MDKKVQGMWKLKKDLEEKLKKTDEMHMLKEDLEIEGEKMLAELKQAHDQAVAKSVGEVKMFEEEPPF